jgi:hypothetical protein
VRNLTFCDIRLHAATETSAFERAMLDDVMPNAGDAAHPPDTLFIRGLYRTAGDGFPPEYRCVVNSILVSDNGFFGMRRRIRDLGAEAGAPRFRLVAGALPDDATATHLAHTGASPSLLMVAVHLPLRMIQESFEKELVAALDDEVGVSTRVNNVHAAFWTRDDAVVPGRTEYLIAATGTFMRLQLRPGTVQRLESAGGTVVQTRAFQHIGTVSGPVGARPGAD